MDEFKILLIDDSKEQKDLLEEAIIEYNKEKFINGLKEKDIIKDDKRIAELSSLKDKKEVYKEVKKEVKGNSKKNKELKEMFKLSVTYKYAKNVEEASILLYKEEFNSLIVDLDLDGKYNNVDPKDLSGNKLLKNIINKQIIPIIVITGFPQKLSKEVKSNIINCYNRSDIELVNVIKELEDYYKNSIFSMFASNGKVHKFNENYLNVEPIEMYMFPNPIKQICNGDIFKDRKSKEKFIVLTPTCDLANHKAEKILFAKIRSFNEDRFKKFNEAIKAESNNKKKEGESWFRNSHKESMNYHFLPKVSFFEGGFIDFSSLICLTYDKEKNKFEERDLRKIGTITDAFKKDITARFSSYYQRQGQPTFNTESVLKNFKKNCEE